MLRAKLFDTVTIMGAQFALILISCSFYKWHLKWLIGPFLIWMEAILSLMSFVSNFWNSFLSYWTFLSAQCSMFFLICKVLQKGTKGELWSCSPLLKVEGKSVGKACFFYKMALRRKLVNSLEDILLSLFTSWLTYFSQLCKSSWDQSSSFNSNRRH